MNTQVCRKSLQILTAAVCLADIAARGQTTVYGPGAIPTPLIIDHPGDYRFVSGTEVRSTDVTLTVDSSYPLGRAGGGFAMAFLTGDLDFEGGLYEGATVSSPTNLNRAGGGAAIVNSDPYGFNMEVTDGVFRGGSVFVPDPALPGGIYAGGPAISTSERNLKRITVYDGLFEGGIVAANDAPDVPISRAPSIRLGAGEGNRSGRAILDVFGGEFVGDVNLYGNARVIIHGSEIAFDPPVAEGVNYYAPALTFPGLSPRRMTVSGRYESGEAFSTVIYIAQSDHNRYSMTRGVDSITIQSDVPEPMSGAIAGCCAVACFVRRTRLSGQPIRR